MSAQTKAGWNPIAAYAPGEERPLRGYATLVGTFTALAAGLSLAVNRSQRSLPERVSLADILLLGTASFKLSRLLAKDEVTSFLRAPFTTYEGSGAPGEVEEKPRGTGMQLAVGELLVCPYCLSQWVVAASLYGLALRPRETRFVASLLAARTLADFLQIAYKAADERK